MNEGEGDPEDLTTVQVGRALAGDRLALEGLVERFTPLLLAQARHRLGPRLAREVDPEDVVSDVWLSALPKLSSLGERDGRRTPVLLRFLSTSVLNKVNNLVARSLRRGGLDQAGEEERDPLDELSANVTGALSRCAQGELCEGVLRQVEALSDGDRAVVVLRAIEQRPNGEVARLLGIEPNTAAVRYKRALEKLRQALPGSLFDEV